MIKHKIILTHSSKVKYFIINFHLIRLIYEISWKGNIKLSQEHSEFNWFTLEEIAKLSPKTQSVRDLLDKQK